MKWTGGRHVELAIWAIWIGSLWLMALLIAPGLFKWLPRPEAGVVAGRFFYMLSWFTVLVSIALLTVSTWCTDKQASLKLNALMGFVLLIAVLELLWMHPLMSQMRQAITQAPAEAVPSLKAQFGYIHALSSVLFALRMIVGLAWGLCRFTVKPTTSVSGSV